MLLGQQFGGRHQRGLQALLDREQRGHRGDHGLAAAHVALHQPQHRARPRQVLAHLREHPRLRRGQRERQRAAQPLDQHPLAGERLRALRLQRDPLPAQAQLVRQQLLDRQPPLRRVQARLQGRQVRIRGRVVQQAQGLAQWRQVELGEDAGGQQLQCVARGQALQGQPDQLAQVAGADAIDLRIHRIQGVAQGGIAIAEEAIARMHHLQAKLAGARGAVGAHPRAGRELRRLLRTEVEEAQDQRAARFVGQRDPQHRPVAEAALHRLHPALDLRRHAGLQPADRRQRGPVLVAARQVQPQVLQADQAAGGKLLAQRRADPRKRGQRAVGIREGVGACDRHPHRMPAAPARRQPRVGQNRNCASTPNWRGSLTVAPTVPNTVVPYCCRPVT